MTAITKDNSTHASDNATPCPRCTSTVKGYLYLDKLGQWQSICYGCHYKSSFPGADTDSGAEVRRMEAAHEGDLARATE